MRSEKITLFVPASEMKRLRRLANGAGLSMAEYVRSRAGIADPPRAGGPQPGAGRPRKPVNGQRSVARTQQ